MWIFYVVIGLIVVMIGILIKYHSEVKKLVGSLFNNLRQSQKLNETLTDEIKNIRKRIEERENIMRKYNSWDE